jgi:hypothetical protein
MKEEIKDVLQLTLVFGLATQSLIATWNQDYARATFAFILAVALNHLRAKDTQ